MKRRGGLVENKAHNVTNDMPCLANSQNAQQCQSLCRERFRRFRDLFFVGVWGVCTCRRIIPGVSPNLTVQTSLPAKAVIAPEETSFCTLSFTFSAVPRWSLSWANITEAYWVPLSFPVLQGSLATCVQSIFVTPLFDAFIHPTSPPRPLRVRRTVFFFFGL